jgi:hypothetical protein
VLVASQPPHGNRNHHRVGGHRTTEFLQVAFRIGVRGISQVKYALHLWQEFVRERRKGQEKEKRMPLDREESGEKEKYS